MDAIYADDSASGKHTRTGRIPAADKTEYMCFNQRIDISILNDVSLKLPAKHRLIYGKWHQYATNEAMDSFW